MMKINYRNEDYIGNMVIIAICLLIAAIITAWGVAESKGKFEWSILVIIIPLIVLIAFLIKDYIKKKTQRNLNLFIMKNGDCIKGKIIKIYDNRVFRNDRVLHDTTAEIEYEYEGEKKVVAVNYLEINKKRFNSYYNKIVNIYVYNNMNYIDIINS